MSIDRSSFVLLSSIPRHTCPVVYYYLAFLKRSLLLYVSFLIPRPAAIWLPPITPQISHTTTASSSSSSHPLMLMPTRHSTCSVFSSKILHEFSNSPSLIRPHCPLYAEDSRQNLSPKVQTHIFKWLNVLPSKFNVFKTELMHNPLSRHYNWPGCNHFLSFL